MNYSTYRFTLDIHSLKSQVSIPVLYQDTWVKFFINLTDGGKPYKLEEDCAAVFYGKKADGTALVQPCDISEDRARIIYTFTDQTASALGTVDCEIRLYSKSGLQLTSPAFIIVVESRVIEDEDIIESDSERSAIDILFETEGERVEAEKKRKESFRAMFVRYSYYPDGTDYTDTYKEGMNYIGLATDSIEPEDKSGYTWCKFISDTKRFLNGAGGVLDLEIEDSTIYYISGYDYINIITPDTGHYTAHMFVSFPTNAATTGISFPEGMPVYGSDLTTLKAGDNWEISVDAVGGMLCMKKKVIS